MAVLTQDQLKKLRESGLNDNEISSLAQKNGFTMPTTTPVKTLSSNEVFSLKKQGLNDTEISTLAQKNNIGLPEQNQDGFFKSTLKDVAKTLLVKPAIRFGQALAAVPVYTFGSDATKQRYQEQIAKDVKVPFTGITVEGQRKFGEGGATQIASDALKSASYLYGGQGATQAVGGLAKGAIAKPIAAGALTGAVGGATYGAGEEMANPEATIGSTLKAGAVGGLAGGVLGGAIPAIGAGIKPTYKIVKDATGKAKMLFASPQDKALYVINKRQGELSSLVNKSSPLKKLVSSAQANGYDPIDDIAKSDLLVGAVNKDGRIDGKLVQERFNEVMDVPEGIIKKKFEETGEKISLDQVQARMAEVLNSDYVPSKIYKQVQNKYDDIVYGLYQKGKVDADGMVKFADLQQEKIDAYKLSNFLDPEKTMGDKAIGRAFKNVIDQDSKSIPELEQINKELGRYLSVKSLIDKLDQKVVKGGRLGKYFAKGFGAVVGSVGGPVGSILTAEGMGALQGQILKGTFGKAVGKDIFEGSLETLKNQSKNVDALQIPQANTINATKNVISKSIPLNKKSSQAGFISTGGKDLQPLYKEAQKYKSAEEFVNKADITKVPEFKKWAGNNKVVEVYHGSPNEFNSFKTGNETYNTSGQTTSGISFADEYSNAEPFSRQYSEKYNNELIKINDSYKKLFDKAKIETKLPKEDVTKLASKLNPNKQTIDAEQAQSLIEWEGRRSLKNRLSEKELSQLEEIAYGNKEKLDKIKLEKDKAINELDKKYANTGKVYKAYLKGKVIEVNGEDIGFGATRNEIVDNLASNEILKINNADTGQYIGTEYMTNNPDNIFIVNAGKTKSQLEQIWKEANSKTSTNKGMTVVNPLTAIAGSSALFAGASKLSKKENKK